MSRIAKNPIPIPKTVVINVDGSSISVEGPKGTLSKKLHPDIGFALNDTEKTVLVEKKKETKFTQAMWGTAAAHVKNMIHGVMEGYEKKLIVEGIGYRVEKNGNILSLRVGFSHSIELKIPEGLEIEVVKNNIIIQGIDKENVGSFAAKVRAVKKTEPYKGKGIRYHDEIVRRKTGKSK